jgi:hypothetical protein
LIDHCAACSDSALLPPRLGIDDPFTHVRLIAAYAKLGRELDARAEGTEVLRAAPEFSLAEVTKRVPEDWDTPDNRQLLNDLCKAGLK